MGTLEESLQAQERIRQLINRVHNTVPFIAEAQRIADTYNSMAHVLIQPGVADALERFNRTVLMSSQSIMPYAGGAGISSLLEHAEAFKLTTNTAMVSTLSQADMLLGQFSSLPTAEEVDQNYVLIEPLAEELANSTDVLDNEVAAKIKEKKPLTTDQKIAIFALIATLLMWLFDKHQDFQESQADAAYKQTILAILTESKDNSQSFPKVSDTVLDIRDDTECVSDALEEEGDVLIGLPYFEKKIDIHESLNTDKNREDSD